jgi:class 3 adenylate cyclase
LTFSCPEGFGIGIAVGSAYRLRLRTLLSGLDEDDYVGYPMNAGSRLQKLAPPYGIVLDSTASRICRKCPDELLRADLAGYELKLVDPTEKTIQQTASVRGLNYKDRKFFKYLTSPSARDYLWKSDGVR